MPVPTRKRAKVGASVVKRLVVSGSRVSKRGVAKGASRLPVLRVGSNMLNQMVSLNTRRII